MNEVTDHDEHPVHVSSSSELEQMISTVETTIYELSIKINEEFRDETMEAKQDLQTLIRVVKRPMELHVRLRITQKRPDATIIADVSGEFAWTSEVLFDDAVLTPFINKVAFPYLANYSRPILDGLARSADLDAIGLPYTFSTKSKLRAATK